MKKLMFVTLALLLTLSAFSVQARPVQAAGKVEYTWTLSTLGQLGWVGGPLFADGTVGGGGAFSLENGQVLADIAPTSWTENAAGEITVCVDIIQRKGPAGALPPTLCIGPVAPTGTPIHMLLLGKDHIFRITEIR